MTHYLRISCCRRPRSLSPRMRKKLAPAIHRGNTDPLLPYCVPPLRDKRGISNPHPQHQQHTQQKNPFASSKVGAAYYCSLPPPGYPILLLHFLRHIHLCRRRCVNVYVLGMEGKQKNEGMSKGWGKKKDGGWGAGM